MQAYGSALKGMPGGNYMGGCMCKKVLKILAGLGLIAVGLNMIAYSPWLIAGLYLLLRGLAPLMCKCDCCGACETKKK